MQWQWVLSSLFLESSPPLCVWSADGSLCTTTKAWTKKDSDFVRLKIRERCTWISREFTTMMTSPKVRLLLSTYRMCGCRVAGLQTSARPQQKHLSKARQKAKEDRRDGDTQWSGAAEWRNSLLVCNISCYMRTYKTYAKSSPQS